MQILTRLTAGVPWRGASSSGIALLSDFMNYRPIGEGKLRATPGGMRVAILNNTTTTGGCAVRVCLCTPSQDGGLHIGVADCSHSRRGHVHMCHSAASDQRYVQ